MHFFLHQWSPSRLLTALLCVLLTAPLSQATFMSETSPFARSSRPLTSENGQTLTEDLAEYRAMFDDQHHVDTRALTPQQFARLSRLVSAYQDKTKEESTSLTPTPEGDPDESATLTDAIQELSDFITTKPTPFQPHIFNLVEQHLIRPFYPQMMPACADVLKKFLENDTIELADKQKRLAALGQLKCGPTQLLSRLKHTLYMPKAEHTTFVRSHTTHTGHHNQKS